MTVIFLKLGLLISLLQSGSAIRCYICQSKSNPACQDPIKDYELQTTECTPKVLHSSSQELSKGLEGLGAHHTLDTLYPSNIHTPMTCQKISFTVNQERVVVRGCQAVYGQHGAATECAMLEQHADRIPNARIHYCDTCGDRDGCNAAHAYAPITALVLMMAGIICLQ